MSRSRISKAEVDEAPAVSPAGGRGPGAGAVEASVAAGATPPTPKGGVSSRRRTRRRGGRTRRRRGRTRRLGRVVVPGPIAVVVAVVGVGRAVAVPRLHVLGDGLATAAAHDVVDLRVDDALHHGGLAHVLERQRVVLALDVDDQRAGPEHPLEEILADVHLGDPLQAQLHGVTSDDALAHEDPGRGQRHDVGAPPDETAEEPQAGDEGEDQDRVVGPARRLLPEDDQDDEARPHADGGEERPEEEDPVGSQLGQQLLVLVQELARQGHFPSVPAPVLRSGHRGGTGGTP